jgi:hypothetical protein
MTLLKLTLAPTALAVALFGASAEAGTSTASGVVNKGDLGISLFDVSTNTEGKGDCDCGESLYGSRTTVSNFQKGTAGYIQPIVITPAAAPATAEIINVPMAKAIRKKLKRVATKDGGASVRRKAGRAAACVFGAPNASGCR